MRARLLVAAAMVAATGLAATTALGGGGIQGPSFGYGHYVRESRAFRVCAIFTQIVTTRRVAARFSEPQVLRISLLGVACVMFAYLAALYREEKQYPKAIAVLEDAVKLEPENDQHLFSLDIGLPLENLKPILRSVIGGSSAREELTLGATNRRGRPFECRVTCLALGASRSDGAAGAIVLMEPVDA